MTDRQTPGKNNMSPDPEGGRHNQTNKQSDQKSCANLFPYPKEPPAYEFELNWLKRRCLKILEDGWMEELKPEALVYQ